MKKGLETIHYSLMVLTDLSPLKQLILSKLVEEIDDLLRPVPTEWRIKGQAQKIHRTDFDFGLSNVYPCFQPVENI